MIFFFMLFFHFNVQADELKVFHLTTNNGQFEPKEIRIPHGEKIILEVKNTGSSAEEFESVELNREKIVPAGQSIQVYLGPLDKGEYQFFGDFHKDTAKGKIVAQ